MTTYITERIEEKKKKQSRAWVSSKRRKGEVCITFMLLSVYLQAIVSVYSSEIPTKSLEMLTHPLTLSNTTLGPHNLAVGFPRLLLTALFCLLLCSAYCSGLSSALISSVLSSILFSLWPSFPRPLPVSWEISHASTLCGFRAKTDKSNIQTGTYPHLQKRMPPIVSDLLQDTSVYKISLVTGKI